MRSISSSFRSSHASSRDLKQHRSPSPPPIPPRTSLSSLSFSEPTTTSSDRESVPRLIYSVGSASFNESDSISTWSTSQSATHTKQQQRSSSTKTSAMRAIRMLFGSAIIRPVTIKTKQEKSQEEPIASSSSSRNSSFNKNRWSQISSSDTSATSECLLNDHDANPCHLINSRRLSASGMTSLLFTPTTSLGLNTMRYWDTKNEQDDVFLSSTYGPISPINVDTNEASSKDALSTTSSSYFSARSSCSSDSTNIKQHPEEEDSHVSLYDYQNNSTSHNENISDKNTTTTTGHHTMRSTLLSKAMLLADTSQQQQQHYPSVGTIGIGNLSSVLSKQWVLHSMRAIKPTNNSNHRAPIPAMLQQPSSTEKSTVSISFSWLHVIYY